MKVDVTVPELAESVTEAIVGDWIKKPGDYVEEGEQLVDVETDKVILEITAPESGELESISKNKNEAVQSSEILAVINTAKKGSKPETATATATDADASSVSEYIEKVASENATKTEGMPKTSPAVRKLAAENNIDLSGIDGTGKDGRITKKDVENTIENKEPATTSELDSYTEILAAPQFSTSQLANSSRENKRVPMTGLRKSISKRLVQSQQETAMLTTFNEVNMQNVIDLRKRYKESFEESHGVKLGFMSFFLKAAVEGLKDFPVINASVENTDIIYHDYFDVGVAVSTPRGLVVPVLRDADNLSFAAVEQTINDLAMRAQNNKLTMDELTGGTFTISNGGIFGSMMSTPIINPPQSAILGMHSIQARPIANNGPCNF